MKIGIIIARFQTPKLHKGHKFLIETVLDECDKTIILLGESKAKLSDKNPLNFKVRKLMIQERYEEIDVYQLNDQKNNITWSKELDNMIETITDETDEVVLYGSRDCFIPSYFGIYPSMEIESPYAYMSATEMREEIIELSSRKFREGVIYASKDRYPTTHPTVDVAIMRNNNTEILLARKPNENLLRFPGGFVDVSDTTYEKAAKREVIEECGNIETTNYRYVGSFKIDDWRYRSTTDGIMTTLFMCDYVMGRPEASDDIAELEWKNITDVNIEMIEVEHRQLFIALKEKL